MFESSSPMEPVCSSALVSYKTRLWEVQRAAGGGTCLRVCRKNNVDR